MTIKEEFPPSAVASLPTAELFHEITVYNIFKKRIILLVERFIVSDKMCNFALWEEKQ